MKNTHKTARKHTTVIEEFQATLRRRIHEIESGKVKGIPMKDAIASVEKALRI